MAADGSVVTGRLLTFRVGLGRFAVLLEDVLGVQDPAEIEAGTGLGLRFQDRPVVAVDARRLWGDDTPPLEKRSPPAAIIVSGNEGATALMVDSLEGIVEGVEMRPLPALVAPFAMGMFRGVTLHGDGGRLVVDPAALAGAAARGGQGGPGEA